MVNKQLHILPYILKSKGNETMKSGQLIEYNMVNVLLLKKIIHKKLVPHTFLKNQNWAYLWINSIKFYEVCFCCVQAMGWQNTLKLKCRPLAFTLNKACWESKTRSRTSLSASFSEWFSKKIFLTLCSINWPLTVSLYEYVYFLKCQRIFFLQIFVNEIVTSWNFTLMLAFLSGRFSNWPKS